MGWKKMEMKKSIAMMLSKVATKRGLEGTDSAAVGSPSQTEDRIHLKRKQGAQRYGVNVRLRTPRRMISRA